MSQGMVCDRMPGSPRRGAVGEAMRRPRRRPRGPPDDGASPTACPWGSLPRGLVEEGRVDSERRQGPGKVTLALAQRRAAVFVGENPLRSIQCRALRRPLDQHQPTARLADFLGSRNDDATTTIGISRIDQLGLRAGADECVPKLQPRRQRKVDSRYCCEGPCAARQHACRGALGPAGQASCKRAAASRKPAAAARVSQPAAITSSSGPRPWRR